VKDVFLNQSKVGLIEKVIRKLLLLFSDGMKKISSTPYFMIFVRTQQWRVSKLAGEESQSGWLGRQDAQLIEQEDGSAAYEDQSHPDVEENPLLPLFDLFSSI
jgi:hypothetical protein